MPPILVVIIVAVLLWLAIICIAYIFGDMAARGFINHLKGKNFQVNMRMRVETSVPAKRHPAFDQFKTKEGAQDNGKTS